MSKAYVIAKKDGFMTNGDLFCKKGQRYRAWIDVAGRILSVATLVSTQHYASSAFFDEYFDGPLYDMITVETIAQVTYEVNRAYCQSIGDNSFSPWEDAPRWQKATNINGVNFHIANPDATPEDSHNSWMKQKIEEGWTWGPVKDPEKKQHPCMCFYDLLPQEQRTKDYLFRQIVHSMKHLLDE